MRYYRIFVTLLFVCFWGATYHVSAQEPVNADEFLRQQTDVEPVQKESQSQEPSEVQKSVEAAKKELEDKDVRQRKIVLASKMHEIRPTREQVDAAVLRAAASLPPARRESFVFAMKSVLNYNAIERISVDAMIETFTLLELESMVEYYSKPEAKSASDKIPAWASVVQPEIINMIDKAMIRVRTGQ
ncbi:MAG: hypothetical protein GC137_00165 [Alphaproteobacteria bacterium]|nr:hypothetical protein [Alphaproteobacteria bacterium]